VLKCRERDRMRFGRMPLLPDSGEGHNLFCIKINCGRKVRKLENCLLARADRDLLACRMSSRSYPGICKIGKIQ